MATLPRPGVEVQQVLRTVSPTVATPTLVPCIVGPCFDIVEATTTSGGVTSLNASAKLSTKALLLSSAGATFAVGAKVLKITVDGADAVSLTVSGTAAAAIAIATLISEINTALVAAGSSAVAQLAATDKIALVGTAGGTVEIAEGTDAAFGTAMGWYQGAKAVGRTTYDNGVWEFLSSELPISKGTAAERTLDYASLKTFFSVGGVVTGNEPGRTSTLNRSAKMLVATTDDDSLFNGTRQTVTLAPVDDADGDSLTGAMRVVGGHASVTMSRTTNVGLTMTAKESGVANHANGNGWTLALTVTANDTLPTVAYDLGAKTVALTCGNVYQVSAANITWGGLVTALNDASNAIQMVGVAALASIQAAFTFAGAGDGTGGLTVGDTFERVYLRGGYNPPNLVDAANAKALVTFRATATAVNPGAAAGRMAVGSLPNTDLKFRVNGGPEHIVTFGASINTIAEVLTGINAGTDATPSGGTSAHGLAAAAVTVGGVDYLQLTANPANKGHESTLEITGGTAVDILACGGDSASTSKDAVQATYKLESGETAGNFLTIACKKGSEVDGVRGNFCTLQVLDDDANSFVINGQAAAAINSTTSEKGLALIIKRITPNTTTLTAMKAILDADVTFTKYFTASITGDATKNLTAADADNLVGGATAFGTATGSVVGKDPRTDFLTGEYILGSDGGKHHGAPWDLQVGDTLRSAGADVAKIKSFSTQTLGGTAYNNSVINLTAEVNNATSLTSYYFKENGLAASSVAGTTALPDLQLDTTYGVITLKNGWYVDNSGVEPPLSSLGAYVDYRALRLDVTPKRTSATPGLIRITDTTTLEADLGPINQKNPLALGIYQALLNAATSEITGIGVDEYTDVTFSGATLADGTVVSYQRAFEFLESQEVYTIVPLSQEALVHQLLSAHVTSLSEVESKMERIGVVNSQIPAYKASAILASGLDGKGTGVANEFSIPLDEGNLRAEVTNAGFDPDSLTVANGVYLDIVSDARRYSVASVSAGNVATVRTAFAAGENPTQGSYTTESISTTLANEDWVLYQKGLAITTVTDIVTAMSDTAAAYLNRRLIWTQPDTVVINVSGTEQNVPGSYFCAGIAGMVAEQNPSQPFTNFPMTGFVTVDSSDGSLFTTTQYDTGAAGGVYWVVQDTSGAPISSRHQLTSNTTSVETRELSIVKSVDYVAKTLRTVLKPLIGRNVITENLLSSIKVMTQAVIMTMRNGSIIAGGAINRVQQDTTNPDKVLVDVTLEVLYPCNYIRVTLAI